MALDDIQTREPESIIAGDSVAWQRSESRYSPGAGWALVYRLLSAAAVIDIDGAEVTDDGAQTWTIQLAAATTGAYTAGLYSYTAFASKASDRVTLASGRICVEPDPAAASGRPSSSCSRARTPKERWNRRDWRSPSSSSSRRSASLPQ